MECKSVEQKKPSLVENGLLDNTGAAGHSTSPLHIEEPQLNAEWSAE